MSSNSDRPVRKNTIWYLESLREEVRKWPKVVREDMGAQLNKVEFGGEPDDFKSMSAVGVGVNEIRVAEEGDQYRVIYVAKFDEAVYVLHVITKKKSQKTAVRDIAVAQKRYRQLIDKRRKLRL